jgi:hypothetical protein
LYACHFGNCEGSFLRWMTSFMTLSLVVQDLPMLIGLLVVLIRPLLSAFMLNIRFYYSIFSASGLDGRTLTSLEEPVPGTHLRTGPLSSTPRPLWSAARQTLLLDRTRSLRRGFAN